MALYCSPILSHEMMKSLISPRAQYNPLYNSLLTVNAFGSCNISEYVWCMAVGSGCPLNISCSERRLSKSFQFIGWFFSVVLQFFLLWQTTRGRKRMKVNYVMNRETGMRVKEWKVTWEVNLYQRGTKDRKAEKERNPPVPSLVSRCLGGPLENDIVGSGSFQHRQKVREVIW